MKRERMRIHPSARRGRTRREILPLDPRDPLILRANAMQRSAKRPSTSRSAHPTLGEQHPCAQGRAGSG